MLSREEIYNNFSLYMGWLRNEFGEECVEKLFGDDADKIANATFAINESSGLAYDGSLIETVFKISRKAKEIASLLPEEQRPSEHSITKVAFLSHFAKVHMFMPNEVKWSRDKGKLYDFVDLQCALRCGERSYWICTNCGIRFTLEEYEAMRIMDKDVDDPFTNIHSSPLSIVIRMANQLLTYSHEYAATK